MLSNIRGINLGNWLVLEKWMEPELFARSDAEDEIWLNRRMAPALLAERIRLHRETYIVEDDFRHIAQKGINLVRIPVPYFIFGDRPPLLGCIEYLDRAFDWAERYGLQILVDLHTVPGSQNGYDNGGLTGVCKWCALPDEVEFVLTVLERLAERYGRREGLYGVEVLNEPISWLVYVTAPSTGKAVDKEEAKGSGHVPMPFLKQFYKEAYRRLRAVLPEEKVIVFHDGFRLTRWKRFFERQHMKNVLLDTHIYIFAMEKFIPLHHFWVYRIYVGYNRWKIRRTAKHIPVVVGEWCISNRYAALTGKKGNKDQTVQEMEQARFRKVAKLQMDAWSVSAGYIYWSYQLLQDRETSMDEAWKESWDLCRCWKHGWMPDRF